MSLRKPLSWRVPLGAVLAVALAGATATPALAARSAAPPAAPPAYSRAADTAPPSTPGNVRVCPPPIPTNSPNSFVGLCWSASTDDVGVTAYDVYRLTGAGFALNSSPSGTSTVMQLPTGAYSFYIVARDAAGNISRPTSPITAQAVGAVMPTPSPTPTPTGDRTPPTRPTGLRDNCIADFPGTAFCWTAATDNVGVTGYDVYRQTVTGYLRVRQTPSTVSTESGLTTGQSYLYFVVARDAAGNISTASDLVSVVARQGLPVPSPSPTAPTCKVTYYPWTWSSGFQASITIANTGTTAINGWTLRFTFLDAGQRLVQGWSALWSQSGSAVTATNQVWNGQIAPGGSVGVGFQGAHTGVSPNPTAFTLNNIPCAVA